MANPNLKHISLKGSFLVLILAVLFSLAATGSSRITTSVSDVEQKARGEKAIAGDTLTLDSVRKMIVGTWIENIAQELGNHEKGKSKWVFTQGGTLQKYRRNDTGEYELYGTYDYNIVGQYKGKEAPEDIAGYLEFTEPEGGTSYMTIESIHRGEKRPHLYVGTHGMAGNTESIYFMPPRVFE